MNLFDTNPNQPRTELKLDKALDFILAGKSTFTLQSITGKHFTYKVEAPKKKNPAKEVHFVKLMTGSDNEGSFTHFATIFDKAAYKHGAKSRITADAQGVRAFRWFLTNLMNGTVNDQVKLFHEGCCARCGRKLTTPESIETGIGPECAKMMSK
jgi:hypothetical protein